MTPRITLRKIRALITLSLPNEERIAEDADPTGKSFESSPEPSAEESPHGPIIGRENRNVKLAAVGDAANTNFIGSLTAQGLGALEAALRSALDIAD